MLVGSIVKEGVSEEDAWRARSHVAGLLRFGDVKLRLVAETRARFDPDYEIDTATLKLVLAQRIPKADTTRPR